jgi:ATP-dependent RNA helicase DDX56/DBP9
MQSIPLALAGKDLLVRARTGSGKTVAYALPLLQKILSDKAGKKSASAPRIRAVVLVPTRELVEQARNNVFELTYYCRDVVRVVGLGSEKVDTQLTWLNQRPDVVVSTPGRLVR